MPPPPAVSDTHGALACANQLHWPSANTPTDVGPDNPLAGVWSPSRCSRRFEHAGELATAVPACTTSSSVPLTLIVPVRGAAAGFAATLTLSAELPVPVAAPTVSHGESLCVVQLQFDRATIDVGADCAAGPTDSVAGFSVYAQAALALTTVCAGGGESLSGVGSGFELPGVAVEPNCRFVVVLSAS